MIQGQLSGGIVLGGTSQGLLSGGAVVRGGIAIEPIFDRS